MVDKLEDIYKSNKKLVVGFLDTSLGDDVYIPSDFGSFDIVIEAFWVNYPYCYAAVSCKDGTCPSSGCTPNAACSSPAQMKYFNFGKRECEDLPSNSEGLFVNETVFPKGLPQIVYQDPNKSKDTSKDVVPFMKSKDSAKFNRAAFESIASAQYVDSSNFVEFIPLNNSFHTASPKNTMRFLETKTKFVLKLAGIGGWSMGGSASGKPSDSPTSYANNWAVCLNYQTDFVNAIKDIVGLGYDGFDFDCENIFAGDTTGLVESNCTNGNVFGCYADTLSSDVTVAKLETLFESLLADDDLRNSVISISPRARDVILSFDGDDNPTLGFFGEVFEYLQNNMSGKRKIDLLNIQFYNDDDIEFCITTKGIGKYAIKILNYVNTNFPTVFAHVQVGILGKSGDGSCDAALNQQIACVTSKGIQSYWDETLSKISHGIMVWGINRSPNVALNVDDLKNTPLSDTWLGCRAYQIFDGVKCVNRSCGSNVLIPTPTNPRSQKLIRSKSTNGFHITGIIFLIIAIGGIIAALFMHNKIIAGVSCGAWIMGLIFLIIGSSRSANQSNLSGKSYNCTATVQDDGSVSKQCVIDASGNFESCPEYITWTKDPNTGRCSPGCSRDSDVTSKDVCDTLKFDCVVASGASNCGDASRYGSFNTCPRYVTYQKQDDGRCLAACSEDSDVVTENVCKKSKFKCSVDNGTKNCIISDDGTFNVCPQYITYIKDADGICAAQCSTTNSVSKQDCEATGQQTYYSCSVDTSSPSFVTKCSPQSSYAPDLFNTCPLNYSWEVFDDECKLVCSIKPGNTQAECCEKVGGVWEGGECKPCYDPPKQTMECKKCDRDDDCGVYGEDLVCNQWNKGGGTECTKENTNFRYCRKGDLYCCPLN